MMRIRRRGEPAGQAGTGPGGPSCVRHRLRADAARNRDAIVAAATAAFAEHGLNASLEEIATRAGVGIGTLYRRFPSRRELIAAALAGQVAEYLAAAEHGSAAEDSWAGLTGFVERICELQASNRGLAELLALGSPADDEFGPALRAAGDGIDALIERAKADGALRADFTCADLSLVLIGAAAVMHATSVDTPDAWRRFLVLSMEGLRPSFPGPPCLSGGRPPPGPPLS